MFKITVVMPKQLSILFVYILIHFTEAKIFML